MEKRFFRFIAIIIAIIGIIITGCITDVEMDDVKITNTTKIPNILGSNKVFGVYATGTNIYAATLGGGLSISTDSGSAWKTITSND